MVLFLNLSQQSNLPTLCQWVGSLVAVKGSWRLEKEDEYLGHRNNLPTLCQWVGSLVVVKVSWRLEKEDKYLG
jgi:hypothetical protein